MAGKIVNPIDVNFNHKEIAPNVFRNEVLISAGSQNPRAAYGGLIITQATAAAELTVPPHLACHFTHGVFILPVDTTIPADFHVSRLFDGRSFASRSVNIMQNGKVAFSLLASFHAKQPDSVIHSAPMPEVKGPEESEKLDIDLSFGKKFLEGSESVSSYRPYPYEFRCTDVDNMFGRKPKLSMRQFFWFRYIFPLGPPGIAHRRALLFMSDAGQSVSMFIPHMRNDYKINLNFTINHTVHFHTPNFRADEWMLMEVESPKAEGSRGYSRFRIWTHSGNLIATGCQEAVLRSRDGRTSKL